jgi:hypothetical protein
LFRKYVFSLLAVLFFYTIQTQADFEAWLASQPAGL